MKMFIPLYKALVRSHLEYGNSVWCPYKMKYIDSIEKVQRRATKTLNARKPQLYREITEIEVTYTCVPSSKADMIEVYKIIHG